MTFQLPAGRRPYGDRSIGGYAAEATALADALGIDRFAVVGYSAGAPYAIAVAAGAPARVRGVGLMAGAGPSTTATAPRTAWPHQTGN